MRIKQDLVPGMTTQVVFTPSVTGEYKVRCAELCGLSHWSMESPVRIVEQADYDQWVSEQTAGRSGRRRSRVQHSFQLGNDAIRSC